MEKIKHHRIESIDLLRGLVMVIMALDHARDYFNYGSFMVDPTDFAHENFTPFLFFTRFITHFCAPVFVFLAGTSAFLYGTKRSNKGQLSKFLWTRGLWLIILEVTLNDFLWLFDISFSLHILQVLWAIGFSMICLSVLIYLPRKVIIAIGILLVAGHNFLDPITAEGFAPQSILWYALHQTQFIPLNENFTSILNIQYPVIPWIGLMALGYIFGALYKKGFDPEIRKTWLLRLGVGCIVVFFLLRGTNIYGDLFPWTTQENWALTICSFFNLTKYPPSLSYLLITIGPSLLLLYAVENIQNRVTDFFVIIGRVPFFYYFLHIFIIHTLAIIVLIVLGLDWRVMILTPQIFQSGALLEYGYGLWAVYGAWIFVVALSYPFCKKYMEYKALNRNKWWLSYL